MKQNLRSIAYGRRRLHSGVPCMGALMLAMSVGACESGNGSSDEPSTIPTGSGGSSGAGGATPQDNLDSGFASNDLDDASLADDDSSADRFIHRRDAGTVATPDSGGTVAPDSGGTMSPPDAGTTATHDAGNGGTPDAGTVVATPDAGAPGAVAVPGGVPSLLPKRMLIGLEDNDGSWMVASKVKWDARWAYFTASAGNGWYNGWSGGAASTDWAVNWMQSAVSQGYIPLVQYYVLQTDYAPASDIGANLINASKTGKIQTPATMKDYFTKFKLLMTAAKQVNKPVIVIVEGDVFGFLEMQSNNDSTTYAAIADSGMPELAGLPNTVAGFGLAYLALRKSVGATNVVMGPDVPAYAANGDFLNYTPTDPIQPHVDYQYTGFFSKLGVGANATGSAYDFTATCPASEDTDQYIANGDTGRSWSASDTASVNSESLNRYAEWMTLFNQASKTPWVIWQIPMGNSNSPDVYNKEGAWAGPYPAGYVLPAGCTSSSTTGCPGGYKDNRPEYFLGTERAQHLAKFAAAGVFGLFFGPGAGGSSDQTSDYYSDGQLFIKSRGGDLISSGGFPLK
jgi:hypothetical protein